MAAVSMSADVTRIAEAKIVPDTGTWGNDGGGGGIADEADVVYQNDTAQSRKIGTSIIGRDYTHGAGTDMDGTPANTAHYIAKIWVTNYAILLTRSSPALHMKIGSSSSDYHWYYLYGNDNYPARGGWQIIAIAPSVTGYQDSTDAGTPNDSSILYWSILGDFSTGSKAENVAIDAIDVGLGLCLVGGDGASADGTIADFVSYDEGTATNRWGFVYTEGKTTFVTGQLAIGQTSAGTSTLTEFTDSGKTIEWTNGLVTTGFHRLLIDLATASTAISFTNCSFQSSGQIDNDGDRGYTTTEDSRPILQVTGSAAATFSLTSCVFDNWASFALSSECTLSTCVITNSGQVDAGTGATMTGTSISGYTGAADTAALLWNNASDPNGELDDMIFEKGTNAHHAIEFGSSAPGTVTLTGWTVSGFNASDGQNDSVLYNNSGGAMTINITGGSGTFSYKNGAGASTTVVVDPVTTSVTVKDLVSKAVIVGAQVLIEVADGVNFPYQDSVTITGSGTTATVTHTAHGLETGDNVVIRGANEDVYNGAYSITYIGVNSYSYTTSETITDSPATGTITATLALINTTTNGSGYASDTRSMTNDQPITGWVRKHSSSPYYQEQPISETVDNTDGKDMTILLISDEG
jgi:hypothetical protein